MKKGLFNNEQLDKHLARIKYALETEGESIQIKQLPRTGDINGSVSGGTGHYIDFPLIRETYSYGDRDSCISDYNTLIGYIQRNTPYKTVKKQLL